MYRIKIAPKINLCVLSIMSYNVRLYATFCTGFIGTCFEFSSYVRLFEGIYSSTFGGAKCGWSPDTLP